VYDLVVTPQHGPLSGSVPVPSDPTVAHRALLLAALAEGASEIRRFSYGPDNLAVMRALIALGVAIDDDGAGLLRIMGAGREGFRAPAGPVDCGGSEATMKLLAGLLVKERFSTVLNGDASLSRRSMHDLAGLLRRRGAQIEGVFSPGKVGWITPPLTVGPLPPGVHLSELEVQLGAASEVMKSALLLSGLDAAGPTYVKEPVVSRDHTERLLRALGVPVATAGSIVELEPSDWNGRLPAFALDVPGDFGAAAHLLAAASIVPGSRVCARRVGLNPTRTGTMDVLRQMGARLEIAAGEGTLDEPVGDVCASAAPLHAVAVAGEVAVRAAGDLPILCALAARSTGVTEIVEVGEEDAERVSILVSMLRAYGVGAEPRESGLAVEGRPDRPLAAADFDGQGDPGIAMSAAILGLVAGAPSTVRGVDAIVTSFPRFAGTLRALGARVEVVRR
jgi:3-phosphoshikimate 1-carboxyvinyltransferase